MSLPASRDGYYQRMRLVAPLFLVLALLSTGCNTKSKKSEGPKPKISFTTISPGEDDGRKVGAKDLVIVLYRGSFEDGTIFDQNWEPDKKQPPLQFVTDTGAVVEGFNEGVKGMTVGEVRKVTIPWQLGYGEQGNETIPGKTNLVFEIKMLYFADESEQGIFEVYDEVEGTGAEAKLGSSVKVDYKAYYLNDVLVDDTYQRGEPVSFVIGDNTVFPGFDAAIRGMKVGGTKTVIIPPTLAQGPSGSVYLQGNQPIKYDLKLVAVSQPNG